MTYEFVLPVSRLEYLKQLGMAAALSQIKSWGILNAALMFWWFLALRPEIPLAGAASILAVSALCQFWLFGITALLSLPQRHLSRLTVGVSLVSLVPILTAPAFLRPIAEWQTGVIVAAAISAFVEVLATKAAYRRWLVADIN